MWTCLISFPWRVSVYDEFDKLSKIFFNSDSSTLEKGPTTNRLYNTPQTDLLLS